MFLPVNRFRNKGAPNLSNNILRNRFAVPCKILETVSFASLIMKNIVAPAPQPIFTVKLICCITFGLASSACCLLKSIDIIL